MLIRLCHQGVTIHKNDPVREVLSRRRSCTMMTSLFYFAFTVSEAATEGGKSLQSAEFGDDKEALVVQSAIRSIKYVIVTS